MIFNVNFDRWIALMLPTFMRRRRIFAFCRALCAPLYLGDGGVYNRFLQARGDHIYRLSHNGQVCYLRAALNDAFGLKKGFEIEDADDYKGEWVYAKDPTMPLLADEARLNAPKNSFIVRVPANIYATRLDKVKAIVEQYRILSKTPIYTPTSSSNEQSAISIDSGRKRWEWPVSVINSSPVFHPGADKLFTGIRTDRR